MNAPRMGALVDTPAGPGRVHAVEVPIMRLPYKGVQVRQAADDTVMSWFYYEVTLIRPERERPDFELHDGPVET